MEKKKIDLLIDINSVEKAIDAETEVYTAYIQEADPDKKKILILIWERRRKKTISLAEEMSKKYEKQ